MQMEPPPWCAPMISLKAWCWTYLVNLLDMLQLSLPATFVLFLYIHIRYLCFFMLPKIFAFVRQISLGVKFAKQIKIPYFRHLPAILCDTFPFAIKVPLFSMCYPYLTQFFYFPVFFQLKFWLLRKNRELMLTPDQLSWWWTLTSPSRKANSLVLSLNPMTWIIHRAQSEDHTLVMPDWGLGDAAHTPGLPGWVDRLVLVAPTLTV